MSSLWKVTKWLIFGFEGQSMSTRSKSLSTDPSFSRIILPLSTTLTILDEFLPYLAQIITSMRRCAACNDLWPWPVSSRSFSIDFAIKRLKYGTSCVRSTACTVLDGFFPYLAQMTTCMRCAVHNDLWLRSISPRSFSHHFCNKTAKIWPISVCPLYSTSAPHIEFYHNKVTLAYFTAKNRSK